MSMRVLLLAAATLAVGCQHQTLGLEPPYGYDSDMAQSTTGADMALTTAACAGSANVIYFDGDKSDYIHPGVETIQVSTWTAINDRESANLFEYEANGGAGWSISFSTEQLATGTVLKTGLYTDTQRFPFEDAGHAGLDVSGDGRGCNESSGSFDITSLQLNATGDGWTEMTASFEQHCENATAALRGCLHLQQ